MREETSAAINPLSFPLRCQHGCPVISSPGRSDPRWVTDCGLTVPRRSPPACCWLLRSGGFAYSPEKHWVEMRHEASGVLPTPLLASVSPALFPRSRPVPVPSLYSKSLFTSESGLRFVLEIRGIVLSVITTLALFIY